MPFTASGTANTFEAALTVDVIDEVGDQLCVRNIMATSGSGTPGTWSTALAFAPTALTAQRATVRAYETSARDGSMVNLVERSVTISPMHPTVMLTSPSCGDRVAPGGVVVVSGLATVFEAVVTVELRDFGGAVVLTQTLLTSEGSVEAPFSGTVSIPASLPPAFYDVVAFNTSPKDGAVENEFAVQILVQP